MEVEAVIVVALIACFVAYFGHRVLKYGGLRGALYGSRVARVVGVIDLGRSGLAKTKLKVLELEDERIVLEQSSTAILAASIHGLPLTGERVDELIELFEKARRSVRTYRSSRDEANATG